MYQNQQVINAVGGAMTISSSTLKEYVSLTHFGGANFVLNNNGVSMSSPQNYQMKIDNDSFVTVKGDNNTFYNQNSWERVNVDKHIIVGDSVALNTDAYEKWNQTFTDITSVNAQPDRKVSAYPLVPGVAIDQLPKTSESGSRAEDPSISELKSNSSKILNEASHIPDGSITCEENMGSTLHLLQGQSQVSISTSAQSTIDGLQGDSPSTQGGNYSANSDKDKLADTIVNTQEKLNEIESLLGEGGSWIENIARNKRVVVGAATNAHPQAVVDPVGRQVPSAVYVDENGSTTKVAGAPEVTEVDNASIFPCGNYNLEIGNMFQVKSGGGGISLTTTGGIQIVSDTVVKLGGYQTIVGGQDVLVKGAVNTSIESPNLNLTSPNQIVLNGNVGINNNMIVKGGVYVDGELYINHITAPLEVQQTLPGFTGDGAYGFLKTNASFSSNQASGYGYITIPALASYGAVNTVFYFTDMQIDNQTITGSDKIVELLPHAHEFVNLPLTLVRSSDSTSAQGVVRGQASALNDPAVNPATGIVNGPKVETTAFNVDTLIRDESSKAVYWYM